MPSADARHSAIVLMAFLCEKSVTIDKENTSTISCDERYVQSWVKVRLVLRDQLFVNRKIYTIIETMHIRYILHIHVIWSA